MRKYQEDLLNQNYLAHLQNLRLIRGRRFQPEGGSLNRMQPHEGYLQKKMINEENKRMLKSIENPKRVILCRSMTRSVIQKENRMRFENNLLENKILNAEPIINTFQRTMPVGHKRGQRSSEWRPKETRMEKLKEFLSEEKKEIKYVGKGSSKLRFKVVLLDLFSSNVCKENLHRLGLQFFMGTQSCVTRLVQPNEMQGQTFNVRFETSEYVASPMLIYIHQYRGNKQQTLGFITLDSKELTHDQGDIKHYSKLIYRNKQEPLGVIEYELKARF